MYNIYYEIDMLGRPCNIINTLEHAIWPFANSIQANNGILPLILHRQYINNYILMYMFLISYQKMAKCSKNEANQKIKHFFQCLRTCFISY